MRQLFRALLIGTSAIAMLVLLVPTVLPEQLLHQVEPGDTLYSIARKYGTEVDLLKVQNNISDPSKLFVGQKLIIPTTHKVEPGDTFYSIARRYNMSLNELLDLNQVNEGQTLRVGTVLSVASIDLQTSQQSSGNQTSSQDSDKPTGNQSESSRETEQTQTQTGNTVSLNNSNTNSSQTGQQGVNGTVSGVPSSSDVTGTMFESVVFRDEKGTTWPVEGDRFTFSGKFPGIAIMGERGKPVMAVAAGRVIYSGPHSTLGKVTFVQHPRGYIYIYGGNETLLVSTGEEIKTGQQLGTLGITPVIQKPQLYFSVWKDGSYIDPASAPR